MTATRTNGRLFLADGTRVYEAGDSDIPAYDPAVATMSKQVVTHRVDEFYAWNDFKSDFRELKVAGNDFLDGMDDFGADLDSALSGLDEIAFCEIEESLVPDLSRYELRRQEWQ